MEQRHNRKGFTLLEILIVIVILGVVAGLAVPVFTSNIEKAKAQEAMASLAAIRSGLTTYYAMNSSAYTSASLTPGNGFIGFDPTSAAAGQTLNFTYALSGVTASVYTVTATCSTCTDAGTITINHSGTVVRSGSML